MTILQFKFGLVLVFQLLACNNVSTTSDQEEVVQEENGIAINDTIRLPEKEEKTINEALDDSAKAELEKTLKEESENVDEVENKEVAKERKEETEQLQSLEEEMVAIATPETIEEKPIKQPLHKSWDELLKKYVTNTGAVNYAGFKQEVNKLNAYLTLLAKNPPSDGWTKAEQLSFWINVYNAATVSLIVDHYPVSSITKLHGGKPWDHPFIKIGSQTYTLNDIEHKIVRPKFKEPRIHFAVNCAAISCPKLLNAAYLPDRLEKQLQHQTELFINNKEKNQLNSTQLKLSKIFEWYQEDFGNLQSFIKKYSTSSIDANASVGYLDYDWGLNKK